MNSNEPIGLVFETVKESRGPGLFVEYQPANENMPFASLFLVYAEQNEEMETIADRIREEALQWFRRFSVPLVATAVDSEDDPIDVSGGNDRRDLLVYSHDGKVITEWGRLGELSIPSFDTNADNLIGIYSSISYSTKEQRKQKIDEKLKEHRTGIRIILGFLFFRRAIIPAGVALAFYLHPILGVLGLLATLGDAAIGGLKVLGYLPKSKKEKQEEERQRRMEHHDYHCRINPSGFAALKAENLGKSLREKVSQVASELHNGNS